MGRTEQGRLGEAGSQGRGPYLRVQCLIFEVWDDFWASKKSHTQRRSTSLDLQAEVRVAGVGARHISHGARGGALGGG